MSENKLPCKQCYYWNNINLTNNKSEFNVIGIVVNFMSVSALFTLNRIKFV